MMNRRQFLSRLSAVGTPLLIGGTIFSVRWGQRVHARENLRKQMLGTAIPVLTQNAHAELLALPTRARQEIRQYFHGRCLKVTGFVSEICSAGFAEKLRT